jgi:hypothetical protein
VAKGARRLWVCGHGMILCDGVGSHSFRKGRGMNGAPKFPP